MGRQTDRLVDGVEGQVLSVGKRGARAEAGVGFPLDGQGCGTWFSPCSCDETCPVWPGSWVLQEEGGQGKVTATRPASGCGVLTFHHTLGLPRSDSSPVRCRAQDRPHRPLSQVAGEELRHSLKTGCECLVLCSGPETGSGSGKVGPKSCTVSFLRAVTAAAGRRGVEASLEILMEETGLACL